MVEVVAEAGDDSLLTHLIWKELFVPLVEVVAEACDDSLLTHLIFKELFVPLWSRSWQRHAMTHY